MKRWLTHVGIAAYLLALSFGIVAHTFKCGADCSTWMYFVVWDMFSGWAAYEGRMEVIGEGESGRYYELAPGPWGEFHPYGHIARQHYDTYCVNGPRIGKNTLEHTVHEPMVRIFVIEEAYPKRFNLPDDQYQAYYGRPKDFHKYCHTRFVLTGDFQFVRSQSPWHKFENDVSVQDNPRLVSDARRHTPYITEPGETQRGGTLSAAALSEGAAVFMGGPMAE
jgi:hypothetical protein